MVSGVFTAITSGSIIPALFDLLYREYCHARLAEMRKQLLLIPHWNMTYKKLGDDASPRMEASTAASDTSTIEGRAELSFGKLGLSLLILHGHAR